MAAVTQIRYRHTKGRAYYDKKLAEGKTPKEALRALKRQISDAIVSCLQEDARRAAAAAAKSPGGQPGNHSASRAARSHPDHRLFGQATPGPATHPTTLTAPFPAPLPSRASEQPGPGPGAARPRSGARRASSTRPPASR
jgi:transposase